MTFLCTRKTPAFRFDVLMNSVKRRRTWERLRRVDVLKRHGIILTHRRHILEDLTFVLNNVGDRFVWRLISDFGRRYFVHMSICSCCIMRHFNSLLDQSHCIVLCFMSRLHCIDCSPRKIIHVEWTTVCLLWLHNSNTKYNKITRTSLDRFSVTYTISSVITVYTIHFEVSSLKFSS